MTEKEIINAANITNAVNHIADHILPDDWTVAVNPMPPRDGNPAYDMLSFMSDEPPKDLITFSIEGDSPPEILESTDDGLAAKIEEYTRPLGWVWD